MNQQSALAVILFMTYLVGHGSSKLRKNDCITNFKIHAQTGSSKHAGQDPAEGKNPQLKITLNDDRSFSVNIPGKKKRSRYILKDFPISSFSPAILDSCLLEQDIARVDLVAKGNDGWLVAYIQTFAVHMINELDNRYSTLTLNSHLNKYVDFNGKQTYNTKLIHLNRPTEGIECITAINIEALTGSRDHAGFDAVKNMKRKSHKIFIQVGGDEFDAELRSPAKKNKQYSSTLDLDHEFGTSGKCIKHSDIEGVYLKAGGNDGWFIVYFKTAVYTILHPRLDLTNNPSVNKWLDGNQKKDNEKIELTLVEAQDA